LAKPRLIFSREFGFGFPRGGGVWGGIRAGLWRNPIYDILQMFLQTHKIFDLSPLRKQGVGLRSLARAG